MTKIEELEQKINEASSGFEFVIIDTVFAKELPKMQIL